MVYFLLAFCLGAYGVCGEGKQKAKKPDPVAAPSEKAEKDIVSVIERIKDKELKRFMKKLHRGISDLSVEEVSDIWLFKAIEEPKNELTIIKFLESKGMINKALPWFSRAEARASINFPIYRAVYLGKVAIVKYLLSIGWVKYMPDKMFIWALNGMNEDMVKLLLEQEVFDKQKLYGKFPSIMPKVIVALLFGFIIPSVMWSIDKYALVKLPKVVAKYYIPVSVCMSLITIAYLFLSIPSQHTEGLGYLHRLSTMSIEGDHRAEKARKSAKIAVLLIREGANPNQKGSYIHELNVHHIKKVEGFTPLHGASKRGNLPLVITLIEYGADVNALAVLKSIDRGDTEGGIEGSEFVVYMPLWGNLDEQVIDICTPLDYAKNDNQMEVYNYLRSIKGGEKPRHYKDLFNVFK